MSDAPFRERDPIANEDAEVVLATGELEVLGRMPWSSNTTLLCDVDHGDAMVQAIYKPLRGERPLWDFPSGLHVREVATYRLSQALGWSIIPPTVLREGPLGIGSLQRDANRERAPERAGARLLRHGGDVPHDTREHELGVAV